MENKNNPMDRPLDKEAAEKVRLALDLTLNQIGNINHQVEALGEELNILRTKAPAYTDSIIEASRILHEHGIFSKRCEDEGDWDKGALYEETPIGIGKAKVSSLGGIGSVSKVRSLMGLGTTTSVPLYGTGIWVILKAPSNADLLQLSRQIAIDKINLGRDTSGQAFSNANVYVVKATLDLIFKCVEGSSLGTTDRNVLADVIKITDLETLFWGFMCSLYPDGYHYRHSCTVNITNCRHSVTGKINLARLEVVDRSRLTENQLRHMAKRRVSVTKEELDSYQDEHVHNDKRIPIREDDILSLTLKVPSIKDYIHGGEVWISGLVNTVDRMFDTPPSTEQRNVEIQHFSSIALIRLYSHWIHSFTIGDEEITDRDYVEQMADSLSEDTETRATVISAIGEFIDKQAIALYGIYNEPCSGCGKQFGELTEEQKESGMEETIPSFIPLNMLSTFFTLTRQRIEANQAIY